MKKLFFLLALSLLPRPACADPFSTFKTRVSQELIKPFALDLGGVVGGASFYDGRALGFPGFSLRFVGVAQSRPDKNDLIMRDAGVKAFGFPMVEAAAGLPLNLDVVAHGLEFNHVTVFGGGLRYGLYKSGLVTKFLPSVGISVFGDKINHSAFKATHFALNAAASWNLPFLTPFLGAGFDSTRVTVGRDAANAALAGISATANGSRFIAGVDFKPLPFTRVHAAYTILHGITGGNFGVGVQF